MLAVEGRGVPCIVPVPAVPSPQQRELSPGLREHLELLFVDPSAPPGAVPGSLGALLDVLDEARASRGHERVGLLGISAWGIVCAAYAQRFPERALFVVMVGTPPTLVGLEEHQKRHFDRNADEERKRLLEQNLAALDEESLPPEERLLANQKAWAPMAWADPLTDPSDLLRGLRGDPGRIGATLGLAAAAQVPDLLREIRCPVLRVHGAHDYIVPREAWDAHGDLGPHVRTLLFEKSGHHPTYEEAGRFDAELLSFVEAVPEAPG